MRNEISITETADTIENAIDKACKKLGCRRDECTFEIIDRPRKKFFGLVDVPAKVRVSIEVPEDYQEAPAPAPAPKKEEKKVAKPSAPVVAESAPAPVAPSKPRREKAPKAKAPVVAPQETPQPEKTKMTQETAPQSTEIYTDQQVVENFPEVEGPAVDINQEVSQADPDKVTVATQYVENIVKGMGIPVTMKVSETQDGLFIAMDGENLGTIIGRRGETLDAIQYLTGLATNRLEGEYLRVTVDCGDYRLKREQTLVELAQRLAQQVLDTNVSKTLEPMNAAERRVIHSTVADIQGVSSHSVGREPTRRVVIKSPTSNAPEGRSRGGRPRGRRPRREDNREQTGRRSDRRRSQQSRRPSSQRTEEQQTKPAVERTPAEDIPTPKVVKEAPLYGKVDLDLD